MRRTCLLAVAILCDISFAVGQQPPGPFPNGVNPPVNQGNGVWRFDRPQGPQPAFFEQLAAMFNLIKAPNPTPFGRSVAFLVGVGTYQHLDSLTHTASDVREMRNFLLQSGGFDTVFEVHDKEVNSSLLNTYMLNYFSKSDSRYLTGRDRFLFYYSGHGGNQGDLGYLLFAQADPRSGDYVTDALNMSALKNWAYVNVARQVLMILDTCNSGLAVQSMEGNPVGGLGADPSGILLTAGTGNQEAYQVGNNQKGYGVFTHAILEALNAGINAQTPFMDVFEVYSRARAAVRDFEIEKGKRMQPDIDHRLTRRNYENANGNFVFLNSNPVAKNATPGERFAGLAVQKEGVGDNLPSDERLRAASIQFEQLKDSHDIRAMNIYVADYKDLAGARTWVALMTARIDGLTSLKNGPVTEGDQGASAALKRGLDAASETWALIKDSKDPGDFDRFATSYPQSDLSPGAKIRADQLRRAVAVAAGPKMEPMPVISSSVPPPARVPATPPTRIGADKQKYVLIKSGEFWMGCWPDDCKQDATPRHKVTITRDFWLAETPVTQSAYQKQMGKHEFRNKGGDLSADQITWTDASAYCGKVGMRLPSEAEWEYVARGTNSGLVGKVAEWVADYYQADYYVGSPKNDPAGPSTGKNRVIRGGGYEGVGERRSLVGGSAGGSFRCVAN